MSKYHRVSVLQKAISNYGHCFLAVSWFENQGFQPTNWKSMENVMKENSGIITFFCRKSEYKCLLVTSTDNFGQEKVGISFEADWLPWSYIKYIMSHFYTYFTVLMVERIIKWINKKKCPSTFHDTSSLIAIKNIRCLWIFYIFSFMAFQLINSLMSLFDQYLISD